jgi:hypothetical protein
LSYLRSVASVARRFHDAPAGAGRRRGDACVDDGYGANFAAMTSAPPAEAPLVRLFAPSLEGGG